MDVEKLILITVICGTLFSLGLILTLLGLTFTYRKKRVFQQKEFEMKLKNKELEMLIAVVQAQETERTNIARNLHDEVGSILTIAKHNLKNMVNGIIKDSAIYEDALFSLDVIDQCVVKIRLIANGMVPHYLMKFGLLKSLERLTDQINKSLEVVCKLKAGIDQDFKLDEQQEIHFYMITVELINNTIKHARPNYVNLEIETQENFLFFSIQHDGIAINQEDYTNLLQQATGMGLESISHRLRIISGELRYNCNDHGGSIVLSVPFKKFSNKKSYVETEE
jgi:signal transduction histidine kinase